MEKFFKLYLVLTLLASCAHQQRGRVPANDQDMMSNEERAEAFISENPNAAKDEKYYLQFFILLDSIVRAQNLVNTFDQRIQSIDNEKDLNRLIGSKLYCKLQRSRQLQEHVEERVLDYFSELSMREDLIRAYDFYRRRTILNEIALGNFARTLQEKGIQIVGGLQEKGATNFDPFNDEESFEFRENYLSQQSGKIDIVDDDLNEGDCLKGESGREPKSVGFDWNRQHWIRSNTADGEFVITYDDGPHRSYTEEIFKIWNASGEAKPGMFWLAKNAKAMKPIVHRAHKEGFFVAVHSYSHCDLGNLAKASSWSKMSSLNQRCFAEDLNEGRSNFGSWKSKKLDYEIVQATRDVEAVVKEVDANFKAKHFRLPFGSGVKLTSIGDRFLKAKVDHYFWKVDSLDWQDKNPRSILNRVVSQMKSGRRGLILFHDIQKQTVEATKLLIQTVKENREWKFVPLSQMEN